MWACLRGGRGRGREPYPPGREERDEVGDVCGELWALGVGSGELGAAASCWVRWWCSASRQKLCSRVVARPGDTARVFIVGTFSPGWWHHPRLEGRVPTINTRDVSPGRATTREHSFCRDVEHHHRTQHAAAAPSSPEPTPSAQTSPQTSPTSSLSSLPGGYASHSLPLPPLTHAVFVVMPQPPCGIFFGFI